MKYLSILSFFVFSLVVMSCAKDDDDSHSRSCINAEYNQEFDVRISEEVCFPDEKALVLSDIQHQFCPCEAICFWEGDLFITFTTTSDNVSKDREFYPSILRHDRSIFDNYEIVSFSYRYDSDNGEVPPCAEDFDPEKVTLTLSISPL